MKNILNITSGDVAGELLEKSSVPGEVLVWHDILYDGPRRSPGWPDIETLEARAEFLSRFTGRGLSRSSVMDTLCEQYDGLKAVDQYNRVVLWFDACLFDQSMLCHILACLNRFGHRNIDLLCVDRFSGIDPYHGLGQLSPEQIDSVYDHRQIVSRQQFEFAERVEKAFANQDTALFTELSALSGAPIPWIPDAVRRWLQEQPDPITGLGRLEQLAVDAVASGCETPADVYSFVSQKEDPPQYWGDITLWAKINALADRQPPLIDIQGPQARLPQWEGTADLNLFKFSPAGSHTVIV